MWVVDNGSLGGQQDGCHGRHRPGEDGGLWGVVSHPVDQLLPISIIILTNYCLEEGGRERREEGRGGRERGGREGGRREGEKEGGGREEKGREEGERRKIGRRERGEREGGRGYTILEED